MEKNYSQNWANKYISKIDYSTKNLHRINQDFRKWWKKSTKIHKIITISFGFQYLKKKSTHCALDKILIFPTRLVLSKRSRKVKRVLQQGNCHFPAMEEKKHINLTLSSFFSFSSLVHQDVNCEGSANSYMNIGIPKCLSQDFKILFMYYLTPWDPICKTAPGTH